MDLINKKFFSEKSIRACVEQNKVKAVNENV